MIEDFTVEQEDGPLRGRYVVHLPGDLQAEMTYVRREDGTVVADHTFVPPSFRGQGIAERLVQMLIDDARRQGFRIVPLCSYVAAQFRRHADWAELRAQ